MKDVFKLDHALILTNKFGIQFNANASVSIRKNALLFTSGIIRLVNVSVPNKPKDVLSRITSTKNCVDVIATTQFVQNP